MAYTIPIESSIHPTARKQRLNKLETPLCKIQIFLE
jgi:hypothetical protein